MENRERFYNMSDEEDVGRSQQTSDIHTLTWQIPNFNKLSPAEDYKIESEQLVFEATGWRIRMHPNGMSENGSEGWISLVMSRTSTLAPVQDVLCEFGMKDNNGSEYMMVESILKKNDRELGPIELFPLSEACKFENNFLLNGTITMICRMRYIEETEEEDEETDFYEIPSSVYDYMQSVGFLSSEPEFGKQVTWKLTHFTEVPMTVGYNVVSPTFQFQGASCFMRLYPNGLGEDETKGSICIELEMSDFLARKQRISCEIGIRDSQRKMTGERFLAEDEKIFGPFPTLKRSTVRENFYLEGGTVIAICIIAVVKRDDV